MIYYILLIIFVVLFMYYYKNIMLIPLNMILRVDTSIRTNFYSTLQRDIIFPVGLELELFWKDIRDEGMNLYNSLESNSNYLDNYNVDIGEENKENWDTIPLRIFGKDSPINIGKCEVLSNILLVHSEIYSCIFSIIQPGKTILPHVGPYDGLLRYQLPLEIPDGSYLHVGGEKHYWKEGEGVLFDESNIHGVVNDTPFKRVVLLIDIERPYDYSCLRWLNRFVLAIMKELPETKNAIK